MPAGISSVFTTWSELASTTFRKHAGEVADNVSKHNALFRRLNRKGKMRTEDGGLSIVEPLEYASNSTYQRYSGFDALNINAVDVITAAEYPWRQVAVNVAASGLELRTNMGESRVVNFTKAKVKNAMNSFKNGLSTDLYSDGTASNQINGLQAIIADAGTGTVGQINSSTFPFWQNAVQSAAAPLQGGGGITPSSTTIESLMLPLWLRLTRGSDMPDMIVFSDDYFTFFEQSQTSLKRYVGNTDTGSPETDAVAGFVTMKYKTADVFFDSSGGIPSAHGYFINTEYVEIVAHRDANITMMDELKSVNQDAVVIPVLWMGNVVCSNRYLQGVVKA
jgi:hypothetical protein